MCVLTLVCVREYTIYKLRVEVREQPQASLLHTLFEEGLVSLGFCQCAMYSRPADRGVYRAFSCPRSHHQMLGLQAQHSPVSYVSSGDLSSGWHACT